MSLCIVLRIMAEEYIMASAKSNQKIHVDKLQVALEKLSQLEEKPKEELTLRESVYFLRDKLKSALKKGYSYQDLSEILQEQKILISAATLKQYLTESNKEAASRKRVSKSKQKKKTSLSSSESMAKSKQESNQNLEESELEKTQQLNQTTNHKSTPSSEVNLSEESGAEKITETQRGTKKTIKAKPKELSSSKQDLSSEFNQY